MNFWTMADAKKDFQRGLLASIYLERSPMSSGWSLFIRSSLSMEGAAPLVDAHGKQTRVFKTLDAAVTAAESIGFEIRHLELRK